MTAMLISVAPEAAAETQETYSVSADSGDTLITRAAIEASLASGETESLIVRTLPNEGGKLSREYGEPVPPFFSTEAIQYVVELGVRHLVVDLPSIDRLFDEGRLSNHRIFWKVDEGSFDVNPDTRIGSTITELAYIPNEIDDGHYLLNLQIAPFASDASPSRPVLFHVKQN
jgi:hypothetical protein